MQECNKLDKNGERHGYWEQYFQNRQLMFKGNYLNGKKNGKWESYYLNGSLHFVGYYDNDKMNGHWRMFDPKGNLRFEGNYEMGQEIGYCIEDYTNESYYGRM